jgi:large subunit ribosomal protein L10
MSRRVKELVTKELESKFKEAKSCVLVEYRGLSAGQMDQVRKAFAQKQARFMVVKNALAALALEKVGMGGLKPLLDGPTAIVRGAADPAALAKAVIECTRGKEGLKVRGGYGEGQVFDAAQVKALAAIPSREVLYARVMGAINTPLAALAGAFASIQRSLACALQALKEKMEKEAPPPAAAAPEAKAETPAAPAPAAPEAAAAAPAPAPEKPTTETKPPAGPKLPG